MSAVNTPGALAVYLTSMVTLSVSIWAMTSSSLMASPANRAWVSVCVHVCAGLCAEDGLRRLNTEGSHATQDEGGVRMGRAHRASHITSPSSWKVAGDKAMHNMQQHRTPAHAALHGHTTPMQEVSMHPHSLPPMQDEHPPVFFRTLAMVPSVTDSPIAGTLTSTASHADADVRSPRCRSDMPKDEVRLFAWESIPMAA